MRAVQYDDYGPADVLHVAERPAPEPGPAQVQIKVAAVGCNPADYKWRGGMFKERIPLPLPQIPGYDVAGVVSALGAEVKGLKVGDRVSATVVSAYAEVAVADESACARLPDGFDIAVAAGLPCAALTGVQMIEESIKPAKGQTVLVTGATGAVGRYAVDAAIGLGARVIAAVRPVYFDEARALGAEAVVDMADRDASGLTFDHVADTVGGPAVTALCRGLIPGGSIVTVATDPIDPAGLAATPSFFIYHADGARLERIVQDIASGRMTMPVAKKLSFAEAVQAHRLLEAGGLKGKLILEP